ncbi:MAG: ABC transporter ATP-binding protein, partial [Clostridia bacterium]
SGGMKRRLNIACGICHEPKLIFLDEPTVGIDPQSRNYILEAIKELNKKGNTVVYTTHYMEEAQELCHRIAIIDMGRIIAQGTLDELRKLVSEHELLTIDLRKTGNTDPGDMARIPGVISVSMTDNQLHIIHDGNRDMMEHVVTYITGKNAGIVKMESRKPNLEDVFLSLTGKVLRD